MILSESDDNRGGGRMSTTSEENFQPLPQFTQSTTSNHHWVNVITIRTDPDGSVSQSFQIISKK